MDLDGIGYARHLKAERERILARVSPSHRARILGLPAGYAESAPKPAPRPPVVRRLLHEKPRVAAPVAAPRGPSAEDIIAAILEATGLSRYEFFREHRSNYKISRARQMGYWLTKRKLRPDLSWPQVGRMFRKDHSTCLTGVRKCEQGLKGTAPICDWLAHPAIVALLEEGDRK